MTPDAALASRQLAGYRVLRSLARDDEAEVLLGFLDDQQQSPVENVTVALKVVPATVEGWRRLGTAVEALERARGDHVVAMLDLDSDGDCLCLVLERLPRGSLAKLLLVRDRLEAGEVVTILAPLTGALQRMHAAGVAHGALDARTVLFRDDGAPVMVGFGSASLFLASAPEVVLEMQRGVVADRRAIVELTAVLCERVDGPRGRAARTLLTEVRAAPADATLRTLRSLLFELAAAVPVGFEPDASTGDPAARHIPLGAPVPISDAHPGSWRLRNAVAAAVPDALISALRDRWEGSGIAPTIAIVLRRVNSWSARRRRVTLAGAAGAIAVVVFLAVVPGGTATGAGPSATAPTSNPSAPVTAVRDPEPETAEPVNADPNADDPLAAVTALVRERDRCLRSLSILCLDRVDQPDSGALRSDRAAIQDAQQGGSPPNTLVDTGTDSTPQLTERFGDSALIELSESASVLVVRGAAGWRIRDVISKPRAPGSSEP